MINNEKEIWKSLQGVSGVEVSTFGRVRTLDRVVSGKNGTRFIKGRVLKQFNDKDGYLQVSIQINRKRNTKRVHQLVAQTFISNPDNLPQVNHKDCDRTNNNVENLEWCDNSYNVQYREKFGEAQNKPVLAINLATLEASSFCSQSEASRVLGFNRSNISAVINGIQKTVHGYWFTNDDSTVNVVKQKLDYHLK